MNTQRRVSLEGVPGLSTKKETPIMWRFLWPWRVITVGVQHGVPYRAWFMVGDTIMCSWWRITATHVAVRIGPGDVNFYFQDKNGRLLDATVITGHYSWWQLRKKWPQAVKI